MSLTRSLRIARSRRGWQPPAGTTHVLEYLPPWLMCPEPDEGAWSLQTLENWLAGTPNGDYAMIDGPPSMTEEDFGQFDLGDPDKVVYLDEAGYLGRFETEVTFEGCTETVPAWWIAVES